jgi:NADH-quinone oxidoreductase subunit N
MNLHNWMAISPEIFLLVMACTVALVDLFVVDAQRRLTFWLTQGSLAVVALMRLSSLIEGQTLYALGNMVVVDSMGQLLGLIATLAVMGTIVYAQPYLYPRAMLKGEFFILTMMVLLGINVMVSANDFLVVYLGLEVMSLSLYALVALRRDDGESTEAAMKYFVLGAIASGFLLYGLSMIYGSTGTLQISEVLGVLAQGNINSMVLVFGLVFIVAGLGFKLGVAPFHMWVPDVYQGAPTAITVLIAGAPKLAAFGICIRLLVEGLLSLAVEWQQMMMVMAVASLVVGNLAAIAQTNLKRMLAYSAIGQVGFMLLGLTSGVVGGHTLLAGNAYSSALFYLVTYVLTTVGSFGLMMLLSRDGFEAQNISDFAGLAVRKPWMAAAMTVFMFSLAGIPPTMGFYAKFAVLQSLITTNMPGYLILAVVAVLISLIAAFYYLRVIKVMYFDENTLPVVNEPTRGADVLLMLNAAAVLVLGLMPSGLIAVCRDVIVRSLAS